MESSTLRQKCSAKTGIKRNNNIFFSAFLILFRAIRILNLDIPFGVLCSSLYAAKLYSINLTSFYFIILFLSVWIVYSIDDLIDGIKSRKDFYNNEYQFHYKNRQILATLIIFAILVCGYLSLTYLETKLLIFGICMILFVTIYFLLNTRLKNSKPFCLKEITIALVYTLGIFGGIIVARGNSTVFQLLTIFNFLLVAYANVLLFALFDKEKDSYLNFNNLAQQFGISRVNKILTTTLTCSLVLSVFTGIYFKQWNFSLILVLMTISLSIILYKQRYFKNLRYYSIITDSVFVLPILSIWL